MKLSIIVPVFNEKRTIGEILRRVKKAPVLAWEKEIIVVDDCSTDGTLEILENLKKELDFLLLRHSKNLGKGAAVKTALGKITGDFVLLQDGDLEYDPKDYENLLKAVNGGGAVVYGRRLFKPRGKGYWCYILGSKILNFLINLLYGSKLTDAYTGYKLFPVSLIEKMSLRSFGFEFEAELTAKLLKAGIKIKEVPIHYYPRTFGEGKKIRPRDGLIGIWTIIKNWLR